MLISRVINLLCGTVLSLAVAHAAAAQVPPGVGEGWLGGYGTGDCVRADEWHHAALVCAWPISGCGCNPNPPPHPYLFAVSSRPR